MKVAKLIIPLLFIFTLIFSVIEPASAQLTIELNQTTAHVGDTVTVTVTAINDGSEVLSPVKVYIPLPAGLDFLSFVEPDRTIQNYTSEIWNPNRLNYYGKGQFKQAVISVKVTSKAEGKTLKFGASPYDIKVESSDENAAKQFTPVYATLTVLGNISSPGKYNDTNDSDMGKNGTGNKQGDHNGSSIGDNDGNGTAIINSIKNLTASGKNNPLQNLQTGGGGGSGNKKAQEVTINNPPAQDNTPAMYILAILLVIGLLAAGYFYGIKREE